MSNMSESERNKEFPVHIDLGKKEGSMDLAVPQSPSGKKGKRRVYYPTVYIDSMPGLEKLPKSGCMLVDFNRTRLSLETPSDGEDRAGVTLELRRICLMDDDAKEAKRDLADALGDGEYSKSGDTDDDED